MDHTTLYLCVEGIERALDLLDTANTLGGILIVVSDGEENQRPFISDVFTRVSRFCGNHGNQNMLKARQWLDTYFNYDINSHNVFSLQIYGAF